jgi:hypothetical protein
MRHNGSLQRRDLGTLDRRRAWCELKALDRRRAWCELKALDRR